MRHKNRLLALALTASVVCSMIGCGEAKQVTEEPQEPQVPAQEMTEELQAQEEEQTQKEADTSDKPELNVNLIANSDFSGGMDGYNTYTDGGNVTLSVNTDQELQCDITSVGNVAHGVQVYYDGFAMKQGVEYEISFDVHATMDRSLDWRIQINGGDYHAYTGNAVAVTSDVVHVSERFTMEEPSDPAPRLCFNMGYHDTFEEAGITSSDIGAHSVMLDNISIVAVNTDGMVADAAGMDLPRIRVNQIGYTTDSEKIAVSADLAADDTSFTVINAKTGETVYEGEFTGKISNETSKETNAIADFTALTTEGTYKLVSKMGEESYEFVISDGVYEDTFADAVKMFYLQRCGEELTPDCAGDFAHASCHDTEALLYGTDTKIDVSGGWHDAGDYGRYVVPGAKAAADLMLAYEKKPELFTDDMGIPESGNGMSDLLDEVRYELEWILKMQNADNGGVYHKVTCKQFPGTVMPEDETDDLVIAPISNTATGDFAAVMAMASRVYKDMDPTFAGQCQKAAENAFGYLKEHVSDLGFTNPEEIVTGEYPDDNCQDEYFWAAAELYKATGKKEYASETKAAFEQLSSYGEFGWVVVSGYGTQAVLSNAAFENNDSKFVNKVKTALLEEADRAAEVAEKNPYGINREEEYEWGSNMGIANDGIRFLLANEAAPSEKYKKLAEKQLDYLFGVNAVSCCFVTGAGTLSPEHTHHRPSQALGQTMPGMLVGGVNSGLGDPYAAAVLADEPPAKCYTDSEQSYSCNEVTIYWNSPLVYLMTQI